MKIVTMKQLRQKFGPVRKGLERGEEYLLMYRSKPLAVVRPYSAETDSQHLTGMDNQEQPEKLTELPKAQAAPVEHNSSDATTKPLEKLGMKKAFV